MNADEARGWNDLWLLSVTLPLDDILRLRYLTQPFTFYTLWELGLRTLKTT